MPDFHAFALSLPTWVRVILCVVTFIDFMRVGSFIMDPLFEGVDRLFGGIHGK